MLNWWSPTRAEIYDVGRDSMRIFDEFLETLDLDLVYYASVPMLNDNTVWPEACLETIWESFREWGIVLSSQVSRLDTGIGSGGILNF